MQAGVLRGAGRQLRGSYINGASYWGIGLPLCWFLAFKQGLGVEGLWYGLLSTTSLTVCHCDACLPAHRLTALGMCTTKILMRFTRGHTRFGCLG